MMEAMCSASSLVNMLPMHASSWWPMVEDLFSSPAVPLLKQRLLEECLQHNEFWFISIDGTVKCILPVMGQYKFAADETLRKGGGCFAAADAICRVLTVRGRTGAVVSLLPSPSEKASHPAEHLQRNLPAAALLQVEHVATDAPSQELFSVLSAIMPNLQTLCSDPLHLCMKYEYATGPRRTLGSAALRTCLSKFNNIDPSTPSKTFGPSFHGHAAPVLSSREVLTSAQISDGTMPQSKANKILARQACMVHKTAIHGGTGSNFGRVSARSAVKTSYAWPGGQVA